MAIANWSSRLESGVAAIDAQHKTLFEAINTFGDSFEAGTSVVQAEEALHFFREFTVEHSRTEEAYMREIGYPGLAAHMVAHTELRGKVQSHLARLESGKFIAIEVAIFYADLLKHHVEEMDMDYIAFARAKAQAEG